MSRSRAYVFTINNWTEEDEKAVQAVPCKYIIYGREGKESTPHLQGCVQFPNPRHFKAVSKLFPRAHVEVCRDLVRAVQYCRKEGDVWENGTPPLSPKEKGVGEKRRYEEAWELAKQGKIEEIDADIRVRHYNTLKKIRADHQVVPEACPVLEHEWYWGASGTGKTRKAREENPGAYLKNPNKWWCGYTDQEVVVIDEWSPCHEVLASHLKQWADHHPFCAETKGASLCIRPRKIIVTSNYSPEACFPKEEDIEPIRRRFKIIKFSKPF